MGDWVQDVMLEKRCLIVYVREGLLEGLCRAEYMDEDAVHGEL